MTNRAVPVPTDAASEIRAAYRRAVAAVERQTDPEAAYRGATVISEVAKSIGREASVLRARMAQQLMDTERLSLSQLAERLGLSKSRADQLIQIARANADDTSQG